MTRFRLSLVLLKEYSKCFGLRPTLRHVLAKLFTIRLIDFGIPYQDLMKQSNRIYSSAREYLDSVGILDNTDLAGVKDWLMEISSGDSALPKNWDSGLETCLTLFGLVRLVKPETILEFGTGNGISTSAMARGCEVNEHGMIHTFDINESCGDKVPISLRGFISFHKVSPKFGSKNSTLNKITSVDLVYIDGAHDYLNSRKDLESALHMHPKYIVCDDIEVTRSFFDVCRDWQVEYSCLLDGRKVVGIISQAKDH